MSTSRCPCGSSCMETAHLHVKLSHPTRGQHVACPPTVIRWQWRHSEIGLASHPHIHGSSWTGSSVELYRKRITSPPFPSPDALQDLEVETLLMSTTGVAQNNDTNRKRTHPPRLESILFWSKILRNHWLTNIQTIQKCYQVLDRTFTFETSLM